RPRAGRGKPGGASPVRHPSAAPGTSRTGQIAISSGSLTGCNAQVTITAVGNAVKTTTTLSPTTISADGVSQSRLRVEISDANGNRVSSDFSTQITASLTSGAGVCVPTAFEPTAPTSPG